MPNAVELRSLSHSYSSRTALQNISFSVENRGIFGLLGPNGSGKSTLFRVLSTLVPIQSGEGTIQGHSLKTAAANIRPKIGVVFQSPSLDKKLTVLENLTHHGHLYGLSGRRLRDRCHSLLSRFQLKSRSRDLVQTLSGGLQRRTELAKALLPSPSILLLDEPSTGLDPTARRDFWEMLETVRRADGVTILLTTHLMDEAEQCDQLALLDNGKLIAQDTPSALKSRLGGRIITLGSSDPDYLQSCLTNQLGLSPRRMSNTLRLETPSDPASLIHSILTRFGSNITSLSLSESSLEDVFIQLTGHTFATTPSPAPFTSQ
jgi:ABC-2 type transport system ATP-binding protein